MLMRSGPPPAEQAIIDVDTRQWLDLVASEHGPSHPSTRLVFFVLGLHMRKRAGRYLSQALIAERSHLSVRTVRRHLKRAENGLWIHKRRRARKTEYTPTVPVEVAGHDDPPDEALH
jgi:hypothetical protein